MRFPVLLTAWLTVFSGNHAFAAEYVAVAPFTGEKDSRALSPDLMRALVSACLSADDAIAVVERADLTPAMAERTLGMTGIGEASHGQSMRFQGIHYLITGSLTGIGEKSLLSLQASDIAGTQIIASQSAAIDSARPAASVCGDAVAPLVRKLLHNPSRASTDSAVEAEEESQDSAWLMQGIGNVHNGDYAKSFPLFLKILHRNPHDRQAKYWLTIAYAEAGMDEFAQKEAQEFLAEFPSDPYSKILEPIAKPIQQKPDPDP